MDRFTTDPDDEENNKDPGWGWTIAAAVMWAIGAMIIIGFAIWGIILWRKVKGIPKPRECYLSTKDVKTAKNSRDYLDVFEQRWENLMKYDCDECTPCVPCEVPRDTCVGSACDLSNTTGSKRIPKAPTLGKTSKGLNELKHKN